jgi:NADH:ubiquinone oxidoreductase subunit F (NADH-binding)
LEFDSVAEYIWDSDKAETEIDYDTILEISYSNGTLKIVLVDGGTSIITFKCNTVEFI